jgi:Na+/proline symporter
LRLIPDFPQELYQRYYAGKSLKAAKNNMFISSLLFTVFIIIVDFIALQIIASNSNLTKDQVIPYFINTINFPGVKGLFCVAVLSIAISTSDSVLNAIGVLFANDILTQIKPSIKISSSLIRLSTFIIGIFAIIISYKATSIFDILQTVGEWCFPVNCFTFLAIILGLKTSKYVVYISMFTGVLPVLIYHMCGYDNYAFILGAAGNLFGLIISHIVWKYFFKSDDPNMYYNQKDNFKRLKDFEYDDDIERERLRKEEIERQKEIELREEFKKTLNNRMKDIVEEYGYDCSEDEIEKIRDHVKKIKEENKK